jgi:ketosteroid isomerase-like protein
MSQEHVEIVRQMLNAFNEEDVERIFALTHRDVEIEITPSVSAEPDTYRGHAGMRRYRESFQEAMSEIRFEAERLYDAGSAVVVTLRLTARGRQTGILVEQRSAGVWTVSEGKVIGVRTFPSTGDALAAVGAPQ